MQNIPRKAPHNPADALAMSYVVQLIGDLSASRSARSLHRDSTGDGGDGGDATAEDATAGYFSQLATQHLNSTEKMTWKRLLSFCLPGAVLRNLLHNLVRSIRWQTERKLSLHLANWKGGCKVGPLP